MLTKERKTLERKAEKVALNPRRPVLTAEQQLEVFEKSRLVLRLKAPTNLLDPTERDTLRKHQTHQIEQFVQLLDESLVNEYGKTMIVLYSCE